MIANIPTKEEMETLKEIAKILIASKLYTINMGKEKGIRDLTVDEAMAKILRGLPLGLTPSESLEGLNIVRGKLTMGAALMATLMKRAGYDWEVPVLSDIECKILIYRGTRLLGESEFTMADAKRGGIVSDMYGKFPRNMLMARAISNAAKWYAADAFGGAVYTPEELDSNQEESPRHQSLPKTATPAPQSEKTGGDETVALPPNVTPMPPAQPATQPPPAAHTPSAASEKQIQQISINFNNCGLNASEQDFAILSVSGGKSDSRKLLENGEAAHLINLQNGFLRAKGIFGPIWDDGTQHAAAVRHSKERVASYWEMNAAELASFNTALTKQAEKAQTSAAAS